MTKISLNTVNYYDISDIYSYEVDNRPLYDLSGNIDILNTTTSLLGFYQEIGANPETEPPTGFLPFTCAYVGPNNLLYPIDISQSVFTINYSEVPIYLVIASLGKSQYKALAFSASLLLSGIYNSFLSSSIGDALKVGPGGVLVDEVYFDLYYSAYNYQNIFVGKILTPNTISFGGNQVSVLSDNRFIAKNINDSTTGLITHYINNVVSSTNSLGILNNTKNSPYPFIEHIGQLGTAATNGVPGSSSPIPVYFSSTPLSTNVDGTFTVSNVESVLDEIHFASPSVSANLTSDDKLGTAGVNNRTLYSFAQDYLLHAQSLSINLSEISQNIVTSLYFNSAATTSTNGIFAKFDSTNISYGSSATNITGAALVPVLTAGLLSSSHGISLGAFKNTGLGGFIGYLAASDTVLNYIDPSTTVPNVVASLVGSNALCIVNKNSTNNAIVSFDTDIMILNTSVGAYYANTPTQALEISNKAYVDSVVGAAINIADSMIPLAGNSSSLPITSSLYWDITGNADTSTVLNFNTLLQTTISSSNPIQFMALTSSGVSGYQIVDAATTTQTLPLPVSIGNDLTTTSWVSWYVASQLTTGSAILSATQTFTSANTFNPTIAGIIPISLKATSLSSGASATILSISALDSSAQATQAAIDCSAIPSLIFNAGGNIDFKLYLDSAVTIQSSDDSSCLVNKKYVDTNVSTLVNQVLGPVIMASWHFGQLNAYNPCLLSGSSSAGQPYSQYIYATASLAPDEDVNFLTGSGISQFQYGNSGVGYFNVNSDSSYLFNGIPDPSGASDVVGAMFHLTCSCTQLNIGATYPGGIFQIISLILKSSGGSLTTLDMNISQDDSYGSSINMLMAATASTTVYLQPGDSLYFLSHWGQEASVSITRIR